VKNANTIQLEREDRAFLDSLPALPRLYGQGLSRPDEVTLDDIKRENQGSIGSCQGNAITSCIERLLTVGGEHKGTQLSRIYAYLASQQLDGLLGRDVGSTISSGIKVSLRGVPTEQAVPYPSPARYPGRARRDDILEAWLAERTFPYSASSTWKVPFDVEAVKDFIAGGGAISIGILWYSGIIPRNRVVRTFRPPSRSGGHAVAILGYARNGNLRFMNSHGDGQFEVTPDAFRGMMRHSWTAAVGIKGSVDPHPVDWVEESPLW
jgi:hypothetical protein